MIIQAVAVGLLGVSLGSFVNALAWRVHEQGERAKGKGKSKKKKLNPQPSTLSSKDLSILHGRSMCVNCHHALAWYDLIPVISWLMLRGRCRYCKKPISLQYPLVELMTAVLAVTSLYLWPLDLNSVLDWAVFGAFMIILTLGMAMVVSDIRWMLLPNQLVYSFVIAVIIYISLHALQIENFDPFIRGVLASLMLGGFFYLIYQLSGGKWIGGGDVRLGFAMGLLLGVAKTFIAASIASYAGLFIIIILAILGKYKAKMRLPFGPLLILGTLTALVLGDRLIDYYLKLSGIN